MVHRWRNQEQRHGGIGMLTPVGAYHGPAGAARRFTQEYKGRVLAEYDAAERGERGEILRREGLYTSHLVEWRRSAVGSGGQRAAAGGRARKDPRMRRSRR